LTNFNNLWPATSRKKLNANDFNFGYPTLLLSPHYLVKEKSRSYWTCYWRVASTSTACIHAGWGHVEHVL